LQFPSGRKDVPNALAYMMRLRAGLPMYEDFGENNVHEALDKVADRPLYLALSARSTRTAGTILQNVDGELRLLADWTYDLPPYECLSSLVEEAGAYAAGQRMTLIAPLEQFDRYTNYGLQAAARAARYEIIPGGSAAASVGALTPYLRKQL